MGRNKYFLDKETLFNAVRSSFPMHPGVGNGGQMESLDEENIEEE